LVPGRAAPAAFVEVQFDRRATASRLRVYVVAVLIALSLSLPLACTTLSVALTLAALLGVIEWGCVER
jgi:hypothetical protein